MNDETLFSFHSASSGVYAAPAVIDRLVRQAAARGVACFDLDLAGVADKSAFLARCRNTLGLPRSFGHNWDALADALTDFSWRPALGYVVSWRSGREFSRSAPGDFGTAIEVFAAAAEYWRQNGKIFLALLDAESSAGRSLGPVPA